LVSSFSTEELFELFSNKLMPLNGDLVRDESSKEAFSELSSEFDKFS